MNTNCYCNEIDDLCSWCQYDLLDIYEQNALDKALMGDI